MLAQLHLCTRLLQQAQREEPPLPHAHLLTAALAAGEGAAGGGGALAAGADAGVGWAQAEARWAAAHAAKQPGAPPAALPLLLPAALIAAYEGAPPPEEAAAADGEEEANIGAEGKGGAEQPGNKRSRKARPQHGARPQQPGGDQLDADGACFLLSAAALLRWQQRIAAEAAQMESNRLNKALQNARTPQPGSAAAADGALADGGHAPAAAAAADAPAAADEGASGGAARLAEGAPAASADKARPPSVLCEHGLCALPVASAPAARAGGDDGSECAEALPEEVVRAARKLPAAVRVQASRGVRRAFCVCSAADWDAFCAAQAQAGEAVAAQAVRLLRLPAGGAVAAAAARGTDAQGNGVKEEEVAAKAASHATPGSSAWACVPAVCGPCAAARLEAAAVGALEYRAAEVHVRVIAPLLAPLAARGSGAATTASAMDVDADGAAADGAGAAGSAAATAPPGVRARGISSRAMRRARSGAGGSFGAIGSQLALVVDSTAVSASDSCAAPAPPNRALPLALRCPLARAATHAPPPTRRRTTNYPLTPRSAAAALPACRRARPCRADGGGSQAAPLAEERPGALPDPALPTAEQRRAVRAARGRPRGRAARRRVHAPLARRPRRRHDARDGRPLDHCVLRRRRAARRRHRKRGRRARRNRAVGAGL